MIKKCPICEQEKDIACFYKNKSTKDGHEHCCKCCKKRYPKKYMFSDEYKAREKRRKRSSKLLKKYNLSEQEFNKMFLEQHGKCLICKTEMILGTNKGKSVCCVDHCHKTHNVRALLCHECNTLIGKIENNSNVRKYIINVIKYLRTFNCLGDNNASL